MLVAVRLIAHFAFLSFLALSVPELPRQLHLPEMLSQVLDRVEECPRRRHFDRVAGVGARVCAADRAPIRGLPTFEMIVISDGR